MNIQLSELIGYKYSRVISGQVILLNEILKESFNTQKLLNFGTVDKGFQHIGFLPVTYQVFENVF